MAVARKIALAPATYREAGVDITLADEFVRDIAPIADSTAGAVRPGPIGGIGGFGALFDLKRAGFKDPILVSSTDGVGTKLRIAIEAQRFDTIGIDLVAMCVNDILVHGAEPLFFLDYFAVGKLKKEHGLQVVQSIADGCRISGSALVGGETAEMPGFYAEGDFDLAGFSVGAVERGHELPRRSEIKVGDVLLGIASSGVHSNGFSLVRRIVSRSGIKWSDPAPFCRNETLGDALLTPTKIYVKSVLHTLRHSQGIKALAHITGSGALGKLYRILPPPGEGQVQAHIKLGSWQVPPVFKWLRDCGEYSDSDADETELLSAFNCGVGMVAVVAPEHVATVRRLLEEQGEKAFVIGEIERYTGSSSQWERPTDAVRLSGKLAFAEY